MVRQPSRAEGRASSAARGMNGLFAALLFHELMEAELTDSGDSSDNSSGDGAEEELQRISQRMPELGRFVASLRAAGQADEDVQQQTHPRPPPPQQQQHTSGEQGAAAPHLPAGARGVLITVGDRIIFLPLE